MTLDALTAEIGEQMSYFVHFVLEVPRSFLLEVQNDGNNAVRLKAYQHLKEEYLQTLSHGDETLV